MSGRLSIVVYEFGLLESPDLHKFFSLHASLFAGNAVIYRYDERGDTVDCSEEDLLVVRNALRFYGSADDVELAINAAQVRRPQMAVNGEVAWRWDRSQTGDAVPVRA